MIKTKSSDELAKILYDRFIQTKDKLLNERPFLAAIDGPCASGKTVLSQTLRDQLETAYGLKVGVIELDHFFLPPALRNDTRLEEPGGNIHYERFQQEVISPLLAHRPLQYRVFDCTIMDYAGSIELIDCDLILIEGVYSHHPKWRDVLNLRIYCHADFEIRLMRIEKRDGQNKLERFINEWIPMEDKYFHAFSIRNESDIIFQSDFSQLS